MNKILPLLSVGTLALVACGQSYEKYDSMFSGCERIETSEVHLVYKCPADQPWVADVKAVEPNGMFKTGGELNLADLYADTANVYVEVSLNDKGLCKEDFTLRTMVAEPVADANWAVIGCK